MDELLSLPNFSPANGVEVGFGATANIIGGSAPGSANVISGNTRRGVLLWWYAAENSVIGNLIGTAADGTTSLGNALHGISIESFATDNTIGGINAGEGNVIANNGGAGVLIGIENGSGAYPADIGNRVLGNSIFGNAGLGIELGQVGSLTPNDTDDDDSGPNGLLNFPVLTTAVLDNGNLNLTGSINTQANKTLRIEFFSNSTVDSSGNGEGERYLGFIIVEMGINTTETFDESLSVADLLPGQYITATATDESGNTSEFSLALTLI